MVHQVEYQVVDSEIYKLQNSFKRYKAKQDWEKQLDHMRAYMGHVISSTF